VRIAGFTAGLPGRIYWQDLLSGNLLGRVFSAGFATQEAVVPKSRVRKKTVYTPPPPKTTRRKVSAPWVGPAIVACLVLGLAWIAVYYVTQGSVPGMTTLGAWNLVVGFAFIIAGVTLSTRWR
jgi:cell division protein CrgA